MLTSFPLDRTSQYVDGEWRASAGEPIEIDNPSTGEVIGTISSATTDDVDRAVAAARKSFDSGVWRDTPPPERADLLRRTADLLEQRSDALADLLTSELGCPRWFAGGSHVPMPIGFLRLFANLTEELDWEQERGDDRTRSAVLRQPIGVVAGITPWNGPLTNPTTKIGPAVAAGCSVVVKAAPVTPLTGFMLVEALQEAGLPPGVVNYIPGDRDAGPHLVSHPEVDKIAFTGSTAAGRAIMASAAERIKRVTLELGGKSAAIMLEDCDVERYVSGVLPLGLMLISGQACIAMTRLLVPRTRHEEVAEALTEAVRAVRVGDPFADDTQVGPVVSRVQRDRVEGYIAAGRSEGATISVGGGRPAGLESGWFVEPTVFVDVDSGMKIAQEEIFGPVVTLIPYDDIDDAVRISNDTIYGLSGSVWTEDEEAGYAVARRMRTGMVSLNGHPQAPGSPFGGFKQSGLGRELSIEGLSEYTELQSIALGPSRS